jgi:hypothetical protein
MPIRGVTVHVRNVDVIRTLDQCGECKCTFTEETQLRHQCPACKRKMLDRLAEPERRFDRVVYSAMSILAAVFAGIFVWHAWPHAKWDDRAGMILISLLGVYFPRVLYIEEKRKRAKHGQD